MLAVGDLSLALNTIAGKPRYDKATYFRRDKGGLE
jgi:hypothetical protein